MKTSELFDVAGLATIVTGAASGIGYAYADAMADNGARVVLLDIDRAGLDQAVAKLKAKGGDVRGAVADVTDRSALRATIDRAAGELGRLDVLFANAGIDAGPGFLAMTGERAADGAFETMAEEKWDKVIATNLTSVFNSIRAAVPHMKKNGKSGGRIVVTTSVAALRPEAIVGMAYMPAKAGAAHLVRQAALEFAKYRQRDSARSVHHQHCRRTHARSASGQGVRERRAAQPRGDDRRDPGRGPVSCVPRLDLHDRR
jgi:NAD(P)-dependent dehydrogenase (short-subunit alcohol dehydrogenase family)